MVAMAVLVQAQDKNGALTKMGAKKFSRVTFCLSVCLSFYIFLMWI